jgi:large subunit ribosomal protein L29
MLKAKDLRERSLEDLRELEKTLARDVFQNRFKNFTNRLDDTSSIRKTRKDLARVKTVLAYLAHQAAVATATSTTAAPPAAAPKAPKKAAAPKKSAKSTEAAPQAEKKTTTKKSTKGEAK